MNDTERNHFCGAFPSINYYSFKSFTYSYLQWMYPASSVFLYNPRHLKSTALARSKIRAFSDICKCCVCVRAAVINQSRVDPCCKSCLFFRSTEFCYDITSSSLGQSSYLYDITSSSLGWLPFIPICISPISILLLKSSLTL